MDRADACVHTSRTHGSSTVAPAELVHVETLTHGWRIDAADVLAGHRPKDLTHFDQPDLVVESAAQPATGVEQVNEAKVAIASPSASMAIGTLLRRSFVG